jgi:hypothetical protein
MLAKRRGVETVTRVAKMAMLRTMGRSDYQRWADPANLEEWWESRAQRLARMIPAGTRVIEFGAGRRRLEAFLDPSCTYTASDLVERGPGTFVCDLNRRPLPDLCPLAPQVAVFAGVLEYLRDVPAVIAWLAAHVTHCAASYAVAHPSTLVRLAGSVRRTYYGYMNAYREADLMAIFARAGFACRRTDSWNDQRLFLFTRSSRAETRA